MSEATISTNRTFLVLLYGLLFSFSSFSQIQATTEDGKNVTLNEDGTWKYIEKVIDGAIENFDKSNCEYSTHEVDDFTGDVKIKLKASVIGKGSNKSRFYASLSKSGDYYFFSLADASSDLGCLSEGRSKAILKFKDGEVLEFIHMGKTDCGDGVNYTGVFISGSLEGINDSDIVGLQKETLQRFKTIGVEKIRIQGSEYYTDIDLTEDGQNYFRNNIPCLE